MKNRGEEIDKKILNERSKFVRINEFINTLDECDKLITEFDEELFNRMTRSLIVDEGNIIIMFKNLIKIKLYI